MDAPFQPPDQIAGRVARRFVSLGAQWIRGLGDPAVGERSQRPRRTTSSRADVGVALSPFGRVGPQYSPMGSGRQASSRTTVLSWTG
jgi:hypothetical protein